MSYNRTPNRFDVSGSWVEYLLILVLIGIVIAIIIALFGPYIQNEVTLFLNDLATRSTK